MPETNWGRKETIIWPPHKPIYTLGAVFFAVVLTGTVMKRTSAIQEERPASSNLNPRI
jgi:hypothetical protein